MCLKLELSNTANRKNQRGSSLVIAIFIIVVLSLLGAALVRMLNSSAESIVYEVYGTRALQAAQSGIQLKLAELFPLSAGTPKCDDVVTKSFSNTLGLENCAYSTSCISNNGGNITIYIIESRGTCEVAGIFTSRTLEVVARDL